MSLKWGKERIEGFSNPVEKAEEVNDWAWWVLFAAGIAMGIMVVLKISGKI